MILTIIFIVMVLVGVIGLVVYKAMNLSDENHLFANVFLLGLGILGVFILGIVIITNNNSYTRSQVRLSYEQEVMELNATRDIIDTIQDDYARSVAIQQYNAHVKEIKQEIIEHQINVNNPWISWLCCYEYKNLDVDAISYITTF